MQFLPCEDPKRCAYREGCCRNPNESKAIRWLLGWHPDAGRLLPNSFLNLMNRCQETVAPAGQGLNEPRAGRRVRQRLSYLVDGRVQATIKFNERFSGPKLLLDFFAADDFTGILQQ